MDVNEAREMMEVNRSKARSPGGTRGLNGSMSIAGVVQELGGPSHRLAVLVDRVRAMNERLIGGASTGQAPAHFDSSKEDIVQNDALRDQVRYRLETLTRVADALEAELRALESSLWSD